MTAYIYSQSWNSTVTTSVYEPNVVKMDLFTNKDGNHIVVQNTNGSNSIKYYLLNTSGSLVRSATIETSSGAEFPNISGNNDKVYIVYKLGSNLKLKKSTDAGQNWTALNNQDVGNNTCNGVDILYGYGALHVVYAMKDNGDYYETYYRKIASDVWGSREDVTGYGTEVGGFPSVAVSDNRVHVSYNTGNNPDPLNNSGVAKERDKLGSNWQTPQTVSSQGETSSREKVQVRTTKLYDFYYDFYCDLGICSFELKVRSRDLSGTSWSNYNSRSLFSSPVTFMGAEQTANTYLHILFGDSDVRHFYFDGTYWSDTYNFSEYVDEETNIGFSAVSNDLFAIWKPYNSGYLKYRQYDATPLAPTGLTITEDANNHPRLDWNVSPEPDRDYYKIYRYDSYGGGWQYLAQTSATTYTDQTLTYCHAVPPAQCPNVRNFYFRVTVVDNGSHESDPSNEVAARLVGGAPDKIVVNPNLTEPTVYSLGQNYPNPFNPTTTISYSLPKNGFVILKVFDILGNVVAALVNETQSAGYYSVNFNASNLPSGIYFYSLTSGSFMVTKKLILLK